MLNLNDIVDSLLEWDFPVTFAEETHQVRPLTLGELATLGQLRPRSSDLQAETLAAIFVDRSAALPWLKRFRPEHLVGLIQGVSTYAMGCAAKKTPAIGARVMAAMAKGPPTASPAPAGSSTPGQ